MNRRRLMILLFWFFFFFQAEDGIRDGTVTGVQTCALPISTFPDGTALGGAPCRRGARDLGRLGLVRAVPGRRARRSRAPDRLALRARTAGAHRSEERRVGKECRYRGPREHRKKNGSRK